MSVYSGPEISNNGLVYHLDAYNYNNFQGGVITKNYIPFTPLYQSWDPSPTSAQDVRRDSIYVKHIEKALREDYKKRGLVKEEIDKRVAIEIDKYYQMEEGDGQGFISFDAYRTLKYLENAWSNEQEILFQRIESKLLCHW
jgi:hypothetical protein